MLRGVHRKLCLPVLIIRLVSLCYFDSHIQGDTVMRLYTMLQFLKLLC